MLTAAINDPPEHTHVGLRLEQIAIGDELLSGAVVDANSAWLARLLAPLGVTVMVRQVVADRIADIVSAMRLAASRSDLVIVSGGLGPTVDDLTAEAAAAFLGEAVRLHDDARAQIAARRARAGGLMRPLDDKQAMLPASAVVLENPVGSAPAFLTRAGETTFIHLPGVPREFYALCEQWVLPEVQRRAPTPPLSRTWKFFGVTESELAEHVSRVDTSGAVLHYRVHFPEVFLTVVCSDQTIVDRVQAALEGAVWRRYFGGSDADFATVVVAALAGKGRTVAVAESCTGGLVGQLITAVPGSSQVFVGGVIAYDNRVKTQLLGVSDVLLAEHGAVSRACAEAMARGARERLGADIGVATTGIAGPGGGTVDKPVGTIFIAIDDGTVVRHRALQLPFDRERNRLATAYGALDLVRGHLESPAR